MVLVLLAAPQRALTWAQSPPFDSGSDESDGPLVVAANQDIVIFDPTDQARWGRILDEDGDGVYNFTTITIGPGSTLRLRGDKVGRPVHWLASGDVTIAGTIDISGVTLSGYAAADLNLRRQVASPGSGGFAGGAGGTTTTPAPTPGEGPGGGSGQQECSINGIRRCGVGGTFTGNRYLFPLIGGSGGSGAYVDPGGPYVGGGGGGGAIVIASSSKITIAGAIRANGGTSGWGQPFRRQPRRWRGQWRGYSTSCAYPRRGRPSGCQRRCWGD